MKKYFSFKTKMRELFPVLQLVIAGILIMIFVPFSFLNKNMQTTFFYLIIISVLLSINAILKLKNNINYYLRRTTCRIIVYIILILCVLLLKKIEYLGPFSELIFSFLEFMIYLIIWSSFISLITYLLNNPENRKKRGRYDEIQKLTDLNGDKTNIIFIIYMSYKKIQNKISNKKLNYRLKDRTKLKISTLGAFMFFLTAMNYDSTKYLVPTLFLLVYTIFSVTWNHYKFKVNTSFVAIPLVDYFNRPLVSTGYNNNISKNSRVFEMNLSSLVPKNATITKINFTSNKTYFDYNQKGNSISDGKVYIVINSHKKRRYVIDQVIIKYVNNEKEFVETFVLELNADVIGNQLLITSCCVVDYSTNKSKCSIYTKYLEDAKYIQYSNLGMINLVNNYYHSPNNFFRNELPSSLQESRKFIVHNDRFGNGKTSLDTLLVYESQRLPIPISFWQENYDHEMLFVLFNRLRKKTNSWFTAFTYQTIPTFIGINLVFITFAAFILDKKSIFPGLLSLRMSLISFGVPQFLLSKSAFMLSFISLGIMISSIYAPEFMIYKQNTSEYYQDFYLTTIKKIIRKKNVILVLEDLDRLPIESVEKCFRLVANLNYQFNDTNRLIGIISYDEEVIQKKFEEKYDASGNSTEYYDEMIEKIALDRKISISSNDNDFKKSYVIGILNYYQKCLQVDLQIKDEIETSAKKINQCIEIVKRTNYENLTLREIRAITEVVINTCASKDKILDNSIYDFLIELERKAKK